MVEGSGQAYKVRLLKNTELTTVQLKAGEMDQLLRVLTVLLEDSGSVPSIHMAVPGYLTPHTIMHEDKTLMHISKQTSKK